MRVHNNGTVLFSLQAKDGLGRMSIRTWDGVDRPDYLPMLRDIDAKDIDWLIEQLQSLRPQVAESEKALNAARIASLKNAAEKKQTELDAIQKELWKLENDQQLSLDIHPANKYSG